MDELCHQQLNEEVDPNPQEAVGLITSWEIPLQHPIMISSTTTVAKSSLNNSDNSLTPGQKKWSGLVTSFHENK